jgi:transcriptional regulator with XRE-family HTH domain
MQGGIFMHGRTLRQLREAKGRTQADVARSVGISPAHLARLESSQRGLYLEDFVNISAALGEKPGNLLPNDLGDIGHLKPLIDRLASVRPEVLPAVAAILESVIQLTENGLAPHRAAPRKRRR